MQTTDHGTYLEVDGRPAVRFERIYAQPLERVWRAVTDPAELRHWFPSPEVSYEARVGGTITLSGDPHAPESSTTKVLAWEPPHRFGFDWGDDQLYFTLSEVERGCRLELLNLLAGDGQAARNAAGWELCLENLTRAMAGTPDSREGGLEEFWPVLEKYQREGFPDDGWRPDPVS